MTEPARDQRTIRAAERVVELLARSGIESAVIGAVALAAHGYPRSTEDLDLAVAIEPSSLEAAAEGLRQAGFRAQVSMPDESDPLGGVIRLTAEGIDRIEVVNFRNPPAGGFPALVELALREAAPYREGAPLRIVTPEHLVLFKLYAGGPKSKGDVLELLSRNPGIDLDALRELAKRFRLDRRFEAWLREVREALDE